MRLRNALLILALGLVATPSFAQHYQSDFPPEQFKARWQQLFDRIGNNAVAVLQGAPGANGSVFPRQDNNFYYLCGIETPRAYLLLDGRARKVTLFLPARNERQEAAEGRVYSAQDADVVKQLTGVDEVRDAATMTGNWIDPPRPAAGTDAAARAPAARPARLAAIYTPFSPAEGESQYRDEIQPFNAGVTNDPWDGRLPREAHFIELLRARFPRSEIRDLSPIMDDLRSIKSPREIALLRRAGQLSALGIVEAMRSTKPGVFEYQLAAAARYVFQVNGARLDGYRSITASGVESINNMHYFRNLADLKDGDLVLMDYAPDCRYYTSDIGRMFPVNGKYAPWQRELLQFVLEYHKAILARIRPGAAPQQIRADAKAAMEQVFAKTTFSKPIYETAAHRLVDTGGGVFSHTVGMAVHDDGRYGQDAPLKPGTVIAIDPQMRVPEEHLYIRFEDTIVVTDTGVEILTDAAPRELDQMEALVKEKGVVQQVPPVPPPGKKTRNE
jgi:Xaa-Pro aminopeptidase